MGILEERAENDRQERTEDNKFFGSYLYLFELRLPAAALDGEFSQKHLSLMYPLVINPTNYEIEDPFTVAISPGTNGGLVVEENGIIQRKIKISGTTGFGPKPLKADLAFSYNTKVERSYFARGKFVLDRLSGQRHMQFLQDRVFRNYADLKRDPRYARDVKLIFHNIKDDEHFQVIPEMFTLTRGTTLYYYDISLIAVAPASDVKLPAEADVRSWFDKLQDGIREARAAISRIAAYISVVKQVANAIAQVVGDVISVINSVSELIGEIANVINGLAQAASDILNRIRSIATTLRSVATSIEASISNFGPTIVQAWHNMSDEFQRLGINGSLRNALQSLPTSRDSLIGKIITGGSTRAMTAQSPQELARSGTALTTADVEEILTAQRTDAQLPKFNSVEYHQIGGSDTLPSLSARFLGDAKYWWTIASLNNLSAPYVSSIPLPNTVRPGQTIVIPSLAQATPSLGESGVLTDGKGSLESQLLFRDAKLVQSTRYKNRLDLQLDATKGNRDIVYVEGVENLKQAMRTRLDTELGENILFPNLGLPRVVGMGEPTIDAEILKVLVSQAIRGDNRIANVGSIKVSNSQSLDRFDLEVDAAVRGFNSPVKLATTHTL